MNEVMENLMLNGILITINGHLYMIRKCEGRFIYQSVLYIDENLMLHDDDIFINEDRDAIEKILEVL